MMNFIILLIVFLVIFFFALSVYYLAQDWRAVKKSNYLKKLAMEPVNMPDDSSPGPNRTSVLESFLGRVMDIAVIESLLVSADASISVGRFVSISLGMGLFFILPPLLLMRNPFVMFLFLMFGASLPTAYYIYRRNKREQTLVKQLPDAIDMMTRSLKAGRSLDGSLHEVGRRLPPPIGTEISTVYDEISMGLPFETAIKNLGARYPRNADIKILCTTFIVQRETGGNLTAILDRLSKTIRDFFKLKMQVKVLTAEGRTTSLILTLIPVGFTAITWFLNPRYISLLFSHPAGKKLLLMALVLEVVAYFVMKKIINIKV
jgi:tight adherence protein B